MLGRLSAVLIISFAQGAFAASADFPNFPSDGSGACRSGAPGYNLDTPIQTLAANAAAARIVEANIPGLLEDGRCDFFKGMSLKTVASLRRAARSRKTRFRPSPGN